ncbi:MAG: glycosyltransferase [Spirochaetales bacterium]|nr:glycosyltransferase [Spirochaetales bacterium]
MSDKLLTIVIPSYNMQDYLPKCLDSLLISEKCFNKLDILVINDGSKDKTSEIAHQYENKYPNVFRVIDKENGNYGSCVNRGLAEAKGEYIKILDADDSFNTENFEKFVQYIQESRNNEENVDCFINDYLMVNENDKIVFFPKYPLKEKKLFSINDFPQKALSQHRMQAVTYKVEILKKMNYSQIEGISYTDSQWVYQPMLHINSIKYFPSIVYNYLIGRVGQTVESNVYNKNFWMIIKCIKELIIFYTKSDFTNNPNSFNFLTNFLLLIIKNTYANQLLSRTINSDLSILNEFDMFFQQTNPALYKKSNQLKNSDKFHFKFIAHWRNKRSIKTVLFRLYRFYCKIVHLKNRLFHKQQAF